MQTTDRDKTRIIPRSKRKAALLESALANMLYEVTHLSPQEDDGSHWCKISAEAVRLAREALHAE